MKAIEKKEIIKQLDNSSEIECPKLIDSFNSFSLSDEEKQTLLDFLNTMFALQKPLILIPTIIWQKNGANNWTNVYYYDDTHKFKIEKSFFVDTPDVEIPNEILEKIYLLNSYDEKIMSLYYKEKHDVCPKILSLSGMYTLIQKINFTDGSLKKIRELCRFDKDYLESQMKTKNSSDLILRMYMIDKWIEHSMDLSKNINCDNIIMDMRSNNNNSNDYIKNVTREQEKFTGRMLNGYNVDYNRDEFKDHITCLSSVMDSTIRFKEIISKLAKAFNDGLVTTCIKKINETPDPLIQSYEIAPDNNGYKIQINHKELIMLFELGLIRLRKSSYDSTFPLLYISGKVTYLK